jgi:cytochrome P450
VLNLELTNCVIEWKEARISDCALDLVARISSRIFLGEELCRNEAWLHIMREYTVKSFKAGFQMTVCPKVLKFIFPWVAKDFKTVLQMHNEARAIITPVIENRRQIKAEAKRKSEPIPVYNDALEWGELESKGAPYDPQDLQLLLSFAAIHTTSNLLGQTLTRLANEPHLVPALREEVIRVLRADGLTKNGLYNLKLMDSTLKETQRIMPDSICKLPAHDSLKYPKG